MTWIGRKKIAFFPVYRGNAEPPDQIPADWPDLIMQRLVYDPDPKTGSDRSLRTYIRSASSGRADFDVVLMPMVTINAPNADVTPAVLEDQLNGSSLRSQGFDAAAAVTLGGLNTGTGELGGFWARFAMVEALGVWAMELLHVLTGFTDIRDLVPPYADSPADMGDIGYFDEMAFSSGEHPTAFTKLGMKWLDASAIAQYDTGAATYDLHAIGLQQPPPPGRWAAVQIGSQVPYLMVEARLKVDQFESQSQAELGIPSEGVIVYRVQTSSALGISQNDHIPIFLLTDKALGVGMDFISPALTIRVTEAIPGGFRVQFSDSSGWAPFFQMDSNFNLARTGAAVVARTTDHMDVFVTGIDGAVYSVYWDDASGWASFSRVDPSFTKALTGVSVAARSSDHMDLFVTGTDGGIYSVYWDNATGWATFFRIDQNFAKGKSEVAVVARTPDHMDLFVTGNDGGIYSAYWDSATGWSTFFRIDPAFTKGFSGVAAIARTADHMDLFVTGTDGGIYSVYWDSATGWGISFRIDPSFAKGQSAVAVAARTTDHMDLFVTGIDGAVYSVYWDGATGWGTFFRIDPNFIKARSPVSVIARNPNHLDVFVAGADGGIYSAYWDITSPWGSFFRIDSDFGKAGENPIAAIARDPDHLDVFVTGSDDRVYSDYWDASID